MADFGEPQSRNEAILQNMLGADNILNPPQSRIEELLLELLEQGGTGGGGGDGYSKAQIDKMIGQINAVLVDNASINILPNNVTTRTMNGITFTVNSDMSITANGTATADIYLNIAKMPMRSNLFLSGCPSGGNTLKYFMYVQDTVTMDRLATDTGSGANIIASNNDCNVNICIRNGQSVSNITFRPMVCDTRVKGNYSPYYPTNVELSKKTSSETTAGTFQIVDGNLLYTYDEGDATFAIVDGNLIMTTN